jgi:hypothetical protein
MKNAVASIALLVGSWTAAKAAVVYSTGFEAPEFTVNGSSPGNWVPYVEVSKTNPYAGLQSLEFPFTSSNAFLSPRNLNGVCCGALVTAEAYIDIASLDTGSYLNFESLGALPPSPGNDQFISGVRFNVDGSITVYGPNGFTTSAGLVQFGVYNRYDLTSDMTAQTFSFSMNGVALASNLKFIAPLINSNTYGGTSFSPESTIPCCGVPWGDAFIDNFTLSYAGDGPLVPEPATFTLLLLGLGSLVVLGARHPKIHS